ncbi:MAG: alkaline phosphatase D family protein, partial [Bacteroidota bacterium]
RLIASGKITTDQEQDYTVKVNVSGLKPGRTYYYRFNYEGTNSVRGVAQTLPRSTSEIKLAFVSCSNYQAGYFNAYNSLINKTDLNNVIHLGDYIYEYGSGVYADTNLQRRNHIPAHEIVSLKDYRTRYAQYRLDKDLLVMHTRHSFIGVYDDHEITNNAYINGAQNHQETEGDYEQRKLAALKAYYEWMPIKVNENNKLYRSYDYGNLAKLIMLDGRLEGRTQQATSADSENFNSEDRSMLGKEQLAWLKSEISNTNAKWIIIGNQVVFSDYQKDEAGAINFDAWDGYPHEKKELIQFLEQYKGTKNIVFVTGDTHTSWASEIPSSKEAYSANEENSVGIEFGVHSVTSAN